MQWQHGEANSDDTYIIMSWKCKLEDYLKNIEPENIWIGDEFGKFWRLVPSRSYVVKDMVCKFGKQSKERITNILFVSMMVEKFMLEVIGKSETHRILN